MNLHGKQKKKCTKSNPSMSTKFTALHWFDKSLEHSRNPLNNDKAFTITNWINAKAQKQIIPTHPFSQLILTKTHCFLKKENGDLNSTKVHKEFWYLTIKISENES